MKFYATVGNDYKDETETIRKVFNERIGAYTFLCDYIRKMIDETENATEELFDRIALNLSLTNRARLGFDWWTIWVEE